MCLATVIKKKAINKTCFELTKIALIKAIIDEMFFNNVD